MSKNTLIAILATGMALLAGAPALAQERNEIPAFKAFGCEAGETARLDAWVERYRTAWGAQDAAAVAALHAPDTEWINAYGRQFQNAADLGRFLEKRLFPAFAPSVSKGEAEAMRRISYRCLGATAIVHLYSEGQRGSSRNTGEDARRTHTHLVLNRAGGDWRIVHTAVMDVRG